MRKGKGVPCSQEVIHKRELIGASLLLSSVCVRIISSEEVKGKWGGEHSRRAPIG